MKQLTTMCRKRLTNAGPEAEVTTYYALCLVLPAWQDCVWCVDVVMGQWGDVGQTLMGWTGRQRNDTSLQLTSDYRNYRRVKDFFELTRIVIS